MQNFIKNKSDFSTTCVDNSTKNDEKINSNTGVLTKNTENIIKSGVLTDKIDTSTCFYSNFDGNLSVLTENSDIQTQNTELQGQSEKKLSNNDNLSVDVNKRQVNDDKITDNGENTDNSSALLTFEQVIDRDFEDFALIYPNISKKSILSDENLKFFAEGKENKSFSIIYALYRKVCDSISSEAIMQEKSRQANKNSATGGLSSTQNANTPFFTREQVQNMTPSDIKKNYDLIRKSQTMW